MSSARSMRHWLLSLGLAFAAAAEAQPTLSTPPATCTWCDIAVTWSGIASPNTGDRLALTEPGSTTFLNWRFTNGASSGTLPLNVPGSTPFGSYVVRLYLAGASTPIATSAPFEAQPSVSGTITSGGSPLAGVSISAPAGALCNPITDASGHWGCVVPVGWSGTVTPSKAGTFFTPPSRSYTNVTTIINSHNFATTATQATVSTPAATCSWCDIQVTWSGIDSPTSTNMLALTAPGSMTHLNWRMTNGASSGTLPLNVPGSTPFGSYVIRLYHPGHPTLVATSAPFEVQPTVSGTVTSGGSPLAGVSISFPAGALCNPITDASGHWGCVIPVGWSGTITPSKAGVLFSPASRSFTNVTNHTGGQNFAVAPSHALSGTITRDGLALSGAAVAGSNGASCTATNASGAYTCAVPPGWSGTVTPSLGDTVFTPASRSYTNVSAAQNAQGYIAQAAFYQVSGTVTLNGLPLTNVTLAATGGPTCSSSNSAGQYSCTVPLNWSGSVTPSASGYSFGPTSRSYTSVASNQSAQSFTGTLDTASAPLYFVHVDHLNTPRLVTNDMQQAVWRWDQQEPFGVNVPDENPSSLGAFEFPLRFPGQYADKETNLYYNMARDYSPQDGRYVQSDPLGVLPLGVLSRRLNQPYAYADSNPISFFDPLGLCPCKGGVWDQDPGDWQVELAFGIYGSTSRVNYACRSNPQLKCTGRQSCIGGGLIAGGGINWNIRGSVSGANNSGNLGGWSGAQFAGGAFIVSSTGAWGQPGGNVSAGPGLGGGVAPYVRCYVFALQCTNCPTCP